MLLTLFCVFLVIRSVSAQITGTTSLLTIPVADIPDDAAVSVGASFVDKKYSDYNAGRSNYWTTHASITFLPFLELGFRYVFPIDTIETSFGDRMPVVRLRVLKESGKLPSVLIGAQDFASTVDQDNFNSIYVVASKHFDFGVPIGVHFGYGSDIQDAKSYLFIGPFGGITATLFETSEVIVEYDADRVNLGLRLTLLEHIVLLGGLQGFDTPIGGASLRFRL